MVDDRSQPSPTEFVAVIVVTYNSAALLADLVASLGPGLDGVAWSLTFVDNDSTDATVDAARALAPEATVIATGRNGGYAAGINAGMSTSPARTAVLVLNPDVRLRPGCVAELLRYVHRPGTGIVVPRLIDARGQLIESQRREPTVLRALSDAVLGARRAGRHRALGEVVTDREMYTRPVQTDWAEGSTLLISAECSDAVGAWDETVLPVLRGDGFRAPGARRRVFDALRAVRRGGSSRGRLGGLDRVVAVARRQSPPVVRQAKRRLQDRAVLGRARASRIDEKPDREPPEPCCARRAPVPGPPPGTARPGLDQERCAGRLTGRVASEAA